MSRSGGRRGPGSGSRNNMEQLARDMGVPFGGRLEIDDGPHSPGAPVVQENPSPACQPNTTEAAAAPGTLPPHDNRRVSGAEYILTRSLQLHMPLTDDTGAPLGPDAMPNLRVTLQDRIAQAVPALAPIAPDTAPRSPYVLFVPKNTALVNLLAGPRGYNHTVPVSAVDRMLATIALHPHIRTVLEPQAPDHWRTLRLRARVSDKDNASQTWIYVEYPIPNYVRDAYDTLRRLIGGRHSRLPLGLTALRMDPQKESVAEVLGAVQNLLRTTDFAATVRLGALAAHAYRITVPYKPNALPADESYPALLALRRRATEAAALATTQGHDSPPTASRGTPRRPGYPPLGHLTTRKLPF